MARSKDAWMGDSSDLRTVEVADVPVKGESVLVQGLPGAYSNRATSEATELATDARGGQVFRVNTEKLEVLKFQLGVVDPKFSIEEAQSIAERFGPAFNKVVAKIDELSAVDQEAIEDAEARFPAEREGEGGTDVGDATRARNGGPDVPARARA